MAWHTPRTWNVGELVTKTMLDEQIRDNMNALMTGTAAGDIEYFTGANAKTPLAKPSVDSILKNTSAGVPSWLAITAIKALDVKNTVDFSPGGQTVSTTTWTDITGATLNLTLTNTGTIFIFALVTGYNGTAGSGFQVRANVGGVADPASSFPFNGGATTARNETLPYIYYATGQAAGTITCKLQFNNGGAGTSSVERGRLMAFAINE